MPYDPRGFSRGGGSLDAQLSGLDPGDDPFAEPEEGLFRRYVTRPVSKLFGRAQSLLTEPLLGNTEAYRAAEARLAEEQGAEVGDWEALPGLGDVISETYSPEFRESALGKPLTLGTRFLGNLVGDPTNWVGAGLVAKAGKVATGALPTLRAAEALAPGTAGALAPGTVAAIEAAAKKAGGLFRDAETYRKIRDALQVVDPKKARMFDFAAKSGFGIDASMAAVAGVSFAPDVAMGMAEGAKAAAEAAVEGEFGEAFGDAAVTGLLGGLGYMMGKGVISPYRAAKVFKGSLAEKNPELARTMDAVSAPAEAADAPLPPLSTAPEDQGVVAAVEPLDVQVGSIPGPRLGEYPSMREPRYVDPQTGQMALFPADYPQRYGGGPEFLSPPGPEPVPEPAPRDWSMEEQPWIPGFRPEPEGPPLMNQEGQQLLFSLEPLPYKGEWFSPEQPVDPGAGSLPLPFPGRLETELGSMSRWAGRRPTKGTRFGPEDLAALAPAAEPTLPPLAPLLEVPVSPDITSKAPKASQLKRSRNTSRNRTTSPTAEVPVAEPVAEAPTLIIPEEPVRTEESARSGSTEALTLEPPVPEVPEPPGPKLFTNPKTGARGKIVESFPDGKVRVEWEKGGTGVLPGDSPLLGEAARPAAEAAPAPPKRGRGRPRKGPRITPLSPEQLAPAKEGELGEQLAAMLEQAQRGEDVLAPSAPKLGVPEAAPEAAPKKVGPAEARRASMQTEEGWNEVWDTLEDLTAKGVDPVGNPEALREAFPGDEFKDFRGKLKMAARAFKKNKAEGVGREKAFASYMEGVRAKEAAKAGTTPKGEPSSTEIPALVAEEAAPVLKIPEPEAAPSPAPSKQEAPTRSLDTTSERPAEVPEKYSVDDAVVNFSKVAVKGDDNFHPILRRVARDDPDAARDLVNDTIVDVGGELEEIQGTNPADTHKRRVGFLFQSLKNRVKEWEATRARERGRLASDVTVAEGEAPTSLTELLGQDTGAPVKQGTVKGDIAAKTRDEAAARRSKARVVDEILDQRYPENADVVIDPEGGVGLQNTSFHRYLTEQVPDEILADVKQRADMPYDTIRRQLGVLHLLQRELPVTKYKGQGGWVPSDMVVSAARKLGVPFPEMGEQTSDYVSRLRRAYTRILDADKEFDTGKFLTDADRAELAAQRELEAPARAETRTANVASGMKGPVTFSPKRGVRVRGMDFPGEVKASSGKMPRTPPPAETTQFRYSSPDGKVWLDFNTDGGAGAGQFEVAQKKSPTSPGGEAVVQPRKATAVRVNEIGGKEGRTAEDIAASLETLMNHNPDAVTWIFPLEEAGAAGRLPLRSGKVERALKILEDRGVIERSNVVAADVGKGSRVLLPTGNVVGDRGLGAKPPIGDVKPPTPAEVKAYRKQVKATTGELPSFNMAVRRLMGKAQDAEALLASKRRLQRVLIPGEPVRRPLARVYKRAGTTTGDDVKRLVGRSAAVAREDLSADDLALRDAYFLDQTDSAPKVDGVSVVDATGVHDSDTVARVAEAHRPLLGELKRVTQEISEALGFKTRFGGVLVDPHHNAALVGENLQEGTIYLSPQMALYEAKRTGGTTWDAARTLVDRQILHELGHAAENAVTHGSGHESSVQALFAKLAEMGGQRRAKWIKELAEADLWKGLDDEAAQFQRVMEDSLSGRVQEGWQRGARGEQGVPTRAAEGGPATTPDLATEGSYGAEAGGGFRGGTQRTVPGRDRGEAGGLGRATGAGRGGVASSGERPAAGVDGAGRSGQRRVALDQRITREQALRDLDNLVKNPPADPDDRRTQMLWATRQYVDDLEARMQAGDKKAEAEWKSRLGARPSPKKGEAWSSLNNNYQMLPDAAKVRYQMFAEMADKVPGLREIYGRPDPVDFLEIHDQAKLLLDIGGPEDLKRKFRSGKKLTLVDVDAARILGATVQERLWEAETRRLNAFADNFKLTGEAQAKHWEDVVKPLEWEYTLRSRELEDVALAIDSGREAARMLAIRKNMVSAADPMAELVTRAEERIRAFLGPRYRDKQELDREVKKLQGLFFKEFMHGADKVAGWKAFDNALRQAAKFSSMDKLIEAFKSGLLGWPSRVANFQSNVLFAGLRQMEKNLGAALSGNADEILLTKAIMRRALRGGFGTWKNANIDAFMLRPFSDTAAMFTEDAIEDFMRIPGAIGGKLGEFVRFNFKALNTDDAFFKHFSKVDAYYRQVSKKVKAGAKGFEKQAGESTSQAIERIVDDLEKNVATIGEGGKWKNPSYKDIHDFAREQSLNETFQTRLPGVVASIQQTLYKPGGKLFQFVFPFVKTPYNIAAEALKRTPLDIPRLVYSWGKMSKAEQIDALGRQGVAVMMGAGLAALAESTDLEFTGAGPLDPEQQALLKESGWAPYSIKSGDRWISYQRLEPVSSLIGMLADMRDGYTEGDFDKVGTGFSRVVGSIAENITNKTFLSGFENIVLAFSDPIRYSEQFLKQTTSGFVPNSVGFIPFGHLARQIDPVYREVDLNPMDIVMSKTPFLSKQLPAQLSPTGGERTRPDTLGPKAFSPNVFVTEKKTPEADAARMLAEINFPVRRVKRDIIYKGLKVQISQSEQQRLANAQQQAMRYIGARLMKDPTFLALPNNEESANYPGQKTKKDVLERAMRRFREPVMAQIRPNLRLRASQQLKEGPGGGT